MAKGPVYVSSGGCCSTRHVTLGDDEALVPAWRLRLVKRRLSSLIDDRKVWVCACYGQLWWPAIGCSFTYLLSQQRIQEADRQKATSVMRGMHNCLWDVGDGITFFGQNLSKCVTSRLNQA